MYYTRMFIEDMKRDPTNVELFDIAQSNSEHRRAPRPAAELLGGLGATPRGRSRSKC